jgi:hypothetical protein
MNIYLPYPEIDDYDYFGFENREKVKEMLKDFFAYREDPSISMNRVWKPFSVKLNPPDSSRGNIFRRGDFLGISARNIVCSPQTWEILKPLIGQHVQLLEITYNNDVFYILKVTTIIDCLDYSKAEVLRSSQTGRVLYVTKYAFKEELIQDNVLFVIPEMKSCKIATQAFKDYIEKHDLQGLGFQQIV